MDAMVIPPKALVVVGDPNARTLGDIYLGQVLKAKNFEVSYADDAASISAAQGMNLVVLSSSSSATTLAGRYKDSGLPVLVLESHVFDDMKLTGDVKATDYDEEDDTRITILPGMDVHPLAAYYSSTVTVTKDQPVGCCGVNWGKPASSAIKVAGYGGTSTGRVSIFAYNKNAVMIDGFVAPGRRVGFFAADTAVQYLSTDGLKLLNAAITWVTEP